MKKYVVLAFFLILRIESIGAQNVMHRNIQKNHRDRSSAIIIGVKGGVNLATMSFTDSQYDDLSFDRVVKPIAGLFVEVPFLKYFSIAPEFMMIGRGCSTSYMWRNTYNVNYDISCRYVDFRLPLACRFKVTELFNPYIFAAPDFAYRLGGKIKFDVEENDEYSAEADIGDANMNAFDFSVVVGAGLRFNWNFPTFTIVTKIEAAYNLGFVNTFSDKELNGEAQGSNVYAYIINGERFNNGIEINISIGVPLKFSPRDGCSGFGNKYGLDKNLFR